MLSRQNINLETATAGCSNRENRCQVCKEVANISTGLGRGSGEHYVRLKRDATDSVVTREALLGDLDEPFTLCGVYHRISTSRR
jgi:hypothetical protein